METQHSPKRRLIRIPRSLAPLVRKLAELPEEVRRDVFIAAEEVAGRHRATVDGDELNVTVAEGAEEDEIDVITRDVEGAPGRHRATVAWKSLKEASGVASLGGDAVVDCDRLYDG